MNGVTHGNGRVYERKFDHDEARRLRTEGLSYKRIADELGVSQSAVHQVLTGARFTEQYRSRIRTWLRENRRELCKGDCGRLVWSNVPGRSGLCPECFGKARAKGVRETELLCHRCEEWKPDRLFPHKHRAKARRGRSTLCRSCETAARQEYRERHKVPCASCGDPCLPVGEKGQRATESGLCRACYVASPEMEANRQKAVRASAQKRRRAA